MKNMEEVTQPSRENAPDGADPAPVQSELEALAAERDRALAEKEETRDRLLRKQAEFDNYRKRMAREKDEIIQFAAMEIARSLLPVLDDFERAWKTPAEGEEYRKGIEMIYKRLYDSLVQAGLSPIDSVGKKFDPHLHQAVDTVKGDYEDHTVVEEFQRGYEFKGRLLRPAMVKVGVRE